MVKIMEIYGDKNEEKKFFLNKVERNYHIFKPDTEENNLRIVNIVSELDAVEFILNIFKNLELKKDKIKISEVTGEVEAHFHFELKK